MDYPTTGFSEFNNAYNHTALSISSTTSTTILPALSTRTFARFQNNGGNSIYLGFGVAAVKEKGFRLMPSESVEFYGNKLYRGAINGISNTASSAQKIVPFEGYIS